MLKKTLFDISSCKCKSFSKCNCERNRKIPEREQSFLTDQRTDRKMVIGNVDLAISRKNLKLEKRKSSLEQYKEKQQNLQSACLQEEKIPSSESSTKADSSEESKDPEYSLPKSVEKKRKRSFKSPPTKRTHYSKLASACDRTGVSDRAAAFIASSVLHDEAGCSETNPSLVIDRSKVRRSRRRHRRLLQESNAEAAVRSSITGLYFDGRKDQTLIQKKIGNTSSKDTIQEEHISIIEEPGSKYSGHIAVKTGSAKTIATGLYDFLCEYNIDTEKLLAIGCDGTAVNTGSKGGVIRILELKLDKTLHWFICQLHANELPLRHLLQTLDGKTSGPRGFTGEIGKNLDGCENLIICDFECIPSKLPEMNPLDLSSDQQYLYQIHQSISTGKISEEFSKKKPGKIAHSRWLTTANHILRLYVSTNEPSEILKKIVEYIMKVYAPIWFEIKSNCSSQNGALHLFNTIQRVKTLSSDIKDIVFPIIQRNAYYAHPENLLICMINDDSSDIRNLAWRRIKEARDSFKGKSVRSFQIPELDFDAERYIDMISWENINITEPPLTRDITVEEINELVHSKQKREFPHLPCHTQAVERCVKLVTEAASLVCGEISRDGFIRSRIESRQKMPSYETKCQFKI